MLTFVVALVVFDVLAVTGWFVHAARCPGCHRRPGLADRTWLLATLFASCGGCDRRYWLWQTVDIGPHLHHH